MLHLPSQVITLIGGIHLRQDAGVAVGKHASGVHAACCQLQVLHSKPQVITLYGSIYLPHDTTILVHSQAM